MSNALKNLSKCWEFGVGRTALASIFAHSVSISVGITQGYSAILIPQLDVSSKFKITSEESSWLASLGAISTPIGSILAGVLGEYLGRKVAILSSSIPFILGWLCIGLANSIWWLYGGRLLTGLAAGMAIACYTYVAEISTPERRGLFQASGPISASFGILLTYTLGWLLPWNTVALISLAFSLYTLIAVVFVPESPGYLLKKKKGSKALASLVWLRRSHSIAQIEYDRYALTNLEERPKSDLKVYFSTPALKPFALLVTLFLLQEMSGIYTILFYAVTFFQDSNLDINEHSSAVIVGVIRLVMSIVAAFLINKFGRKTLCILSSAGMALTMTVAGVYFKLHEMYPEDIQLLPIIPLVCVLLNVLFSMAGMLPMPWILVAEMFPLQVRPIMSGIVICIAQCFIFGSVKIYPDMILYLNFSGTLLVFACASICSLLFCKFLLYETKNKSLAEIEEHFQNKCDSNLTLINVPAIAVFPTSVDATSNHKINGEANKQKIR